MITLSLNIRFLILLGVLVFSSTAFAQLSKKAIFYRCYAQLTHEHVPPNSKWLGEIERGKDPIEACMEVLNTANFTANNRNRINNTNDQIARSVLRVMHNLHYSWFGTRHFPEVSSQYVRDMGNFFDSSTPALYMTKALFDENTPYRSILQGNRTLKSDRVTAPTRTPYRGYELNSSDLKKQWIFRGIPTVETGDLLGVDLQPLNWNVRYSRVKERDKPALETGNIIVNRHLGGGLLGSSPYIFQASKLTTLNPRMNGGLKTNRIWAKAIFEDILCRELPVVRESDGRSFVNTGSPLSFRKTSSCVKCHTSIDRMAGVTRHIYYKNLGGSHNPGHASPLYVHNTNANLPSSIFPIRGESNYYQRKTEGVLYYRGHAGNLVDQKVNNVEELGRAIADQDEMYVCLAKRYFRYFTGADVDISDVADPEHPGLTLEQKKYRELVIDLGKSLKVHQNPKRLIRDILSRPEYKESDFGLRSLASE